MFPFERVPYNNYHTYRPAWESRRGQGIPRFSGFHPPSRWSMPRFSVPPFLSNRNRTHEMDGVGGSITHRRCHQLAAASKVGAKSGVDQVQNRDGIALDKSVRVDHGYTIQEVSNFEMLRLKWPSLALLAMDAERYVYSDPQACLVKLRCFVQGIVELLIPMECSGSIFNLCTEINSKSVKSIAASAIRKKMHSLRIYGNLAAHNRAVTKEDAQLQLENAFEVGRWFCLKYSTLSCKSIPGFQMPKAPLETSERHGEEKDKRMEAVVDHPKANPSDLPVVPEEKHNEIHPQENDAECIADGLTDVIVKVAQRKPGDVGIEACRKNIMKSEVHPSEVLVRSRTGGESLGEVPDLSDFPNRNLNKPYVHYRVQEEKKVEQCHANKPQKKRSKARTSVKPVNKYEDLSPEAYRDKWSSYIKPANFVLTSTKKHDSGAAAVLALHSPLMVTNKPDSSCFTGWATLNKALKFVFSAKKSTRLIDRTLSKLKTPLRSAVVVGKTRLKMIRRYKVLVYGDCLPGSWSNAKPSVRQFLYTSGVGTNEQNKGSLKSTLEPMMQEHLHERLFENLHPQPKHPRTFQSSHQKQVAPEKNTNPGKLPTFNDVGKISMDEINERDSSTRVKEQLFSLHDLSNDYQYYQNKYGIKSQYTLDRLFETRGKISQIHAAISHAKGCNPKFEDMDISFLQWHLGPQGLPVRLRDLFRSTLEYHELVNNDFLRRRMPSAIIA